MKKFCSILILIVLLLNSSVMVLISQAVEVVSEMLSAEVENNDIQSMQDVVVEKYINYANNKERGTMVQLKVGVGLQKGSQNEIVEEVYITDRTVIIECPKISERVPTRVEVIGKDANYQNGIITIHEEYEQKLKYEGKKEYTLILFYGEDCYTDINEERVLDTKVSVEQTLENSKVSTTSEQTVTIQGEAINQTTVTENIGTIGSVDYETEAIYNGYINSNIENGTAYDTEYKETAKVMISNKNIAGLFIITSNNAFAFQGEEISNNGNLLYKNLIFEKNKIEDILGENGEIRILGQDDQILDVINNEVDANEDGIYLYTFNEPVENIKLQISNIAKEGILEFNTTKVIKSTLLQNVDLIKNRLNISGTETTSIMIIDEATQTEVASEETTTIYVEDLENEIAIQNSTEKISMSVNKQQLTNNAQNELTLTATLEKNSSANKLFENPTVFIEFPEEVDKIILKDAQVLHDLELTKQEAVVETNAEGKQVIRVSLTGKQTQYTKEEDITKGTNILISATVILKQNIESKDSAIKMRCNENTYEQSIRIVEKNEIKTNSQNTNIVDGTVVNSNGLRIDTKVIAGDKILGNNETIYEEQILKYEVKVTNTTDNNIENIKIVGNIPEGMTYVNLVEGTFNDENYEFVPDETIKQKEIIVGALSAGQTGTYYYEVKVNNLLDTEEEKEINSDVKVFINDSEISTYTLTNIIRQSEIDVELGVYTNREFRNGLTYYIKLANISSQDLQNVNLNVPFPKYAQVREINVWDEKANYQKSINGNMASVTFNNVKPVGSEEDLKDLDQLGPVVGLTHRLNEIIIIIEVAINVEECETNEEHSWNIATAATIETESKKIYKSNENRASGYIEEVTVNQTSEKAGEIIQVEDEIIYTFTIENIGKVIPEWGEYTSVNFKDYIPNELEVISVDYTSNEVHRGLVDGKRVWEINPITKSLDKHEIEEINDKDNSESPRLDLDLNVKLNESITVTIKAKAKIVYVDTEIQNYAIVTGDYIKTKKSNIIQNTIKGYKAVIEEEDKDLVDPVDPDNPDNPDNPETKKYKISGLAWVDENENGNREEKEQKLSGIEVMLLDIENDKYLQDANGNNIIKVTNGVGRYSFENLNPGKYYVVFRYNTQDYELTTYQKPGVSLTSNSDAMQKETIVNGKKEFVAITDIIDLKSNKENIDIGLVKNKIFDLKVEKYIQKITVQNSKGTKEYSYNDKKIAKVEIPAKEIEGSTVIIEYKIEVTNVGELAGTVNELVDVMPSNLEFKSELNSSWYKTVGNNISNTNVSTKEIKPGESIEETIILTKTLDGEIETYSNIAKIGISDNIKHISDKNTENDSDKVDIIISVKTGSVAEYIGTLIATLIVLAVMISIVIILIKKNHDKILRILCFVLIMFVTIGIKTNIIADSIDPDNGGGPWYITDGNVDVECQKPGYHLCNACSFTQSEEIISSSTRWDDVNVSVNLAKGNVGEVIFKRTGNYDIYGPFQVTYEAGSIIQPTVQGITNIGQSIPTDIDYVLLDEDERTPINSITAGRTFYIRVSSNVQALTNVSITASKSVTVYGKSEEWYYIKEVFSGGPHRGLDENNQIVEISSADQVQWFRSVDIRRERNESKQKTIKDTVTWEMPKTLRITKVDYDDNSIVLPNIKFVLRNDTLGRYVKQNETDLSITYVVNESDATSFITNAQGIIEVKGLKPGEYTFIEKENPYHGYDNNKNVNDTRKQTISANNSLILYKAKNKKMLGNIDIEKQNSENSAVKLNNVEFVLLDNTGTRYVKVAVEGKTGFQTGSANKLYGTMKVTKQEYTTNFAEATIFVTDSNGKIHIENIALQSSDTNIDNNVVNAYILREIYNPHYGYELDPDYITWKVNGVDVGIRNSQLTFTMQNKVTTNIVAINEQKYVRISGYVWEDMPEGKDNLRDDTYKAGTDKLVEGIKVLLKNTTTGKTYERWTDSNGAYLFGSKEGETYSEDNILLRDISNYYIEIIYNGMKYTNVIPQINIANGSKIVEGTNRTTFNNKFATIEGGIAKGDIGQGQTQGYAVDENGNRVENIYYTEPEANKSQITYTEGNTNVDENPAIKLSDYYAISKYRISATTRENGYNLKTSHQASDEEIRNINLGIYNREQVDLAISSDIEDLYVKLNGYTHTYHYATRNKYLKNDGAFNVGVKFGDKYLNKYTRTIYQSSVSYFAEDRENNKVEVNVVYKITTKNESSTLTGVINQINNYYDKEYTPQEVYYKVGEVKVPITNWAVGSETYVDGRLNVLQINLQDRYIEAGEMSEIYIEYKVSDEAVLGLLNEDATLENLSEIVSYSTYKKTPETGYVRYASIDEDSAPNNAIIELDENDKFVKTTFEDDTDMAPSVVLQAEKNNTVSGTVFEDSQTQESKNKNERLGNGIYEEETENVVVNAKVELLEAYDDNDNVDESIKGTIKYDAEGNPIVATLYQTRVGENGKIEKVLVKAETYTDDNGNYQFVGVIPDGYVIRYTYGEGTKIKEKGTSNYIDIDVRDYKSTIIASNEIKRALNIQPNTAVIEGRGNYNWNTLQEKDGNGNIIRYSDAVDEILERMQQEQEDDTIQYNTIETQAKEMKARTAAFIIGVEFENINSSSNVYLRDINGEVVVDENGEPMPDPNFYSENNNMDFGIILRPLVDLVLDKNLTYMSIQLANGQMLANGNPYEQDLPYTRAVDDNIYVDMDADLIQGAALNMEYDIKLINNSEVDYKFTDLATDNAIAIAGRRYYYFGDSTGAEKIDKYVKLVGDYLDGEVAYDINQMNEGLLEGWEITTAEKLYEEGRISKETRDVLLEEKHNVFITTEFNKGLETSENPNRATSKTVKIKVSKLLGAKDELVFTNDAEILEVYAIARKTGIFATPGNLIPQRAVEKDEDSVKLIIMPPTGGNDYTGYVVTAIGSLLIIIAGVILIKKRMSERH